MPKFSRKRTNDRIDELIGHTAPPIRGKETMSVQDQAAQLRSLADQSHLRAMVNEIKEKMYETVMAAAQILGDRHPGTNVIDGQGAGIDIKAEELVQAIGMLEFAINNIADDLMK